MGFEVTRRALLASAALAAATRPARAAFVDAPDIVLFCNPTLVAPLRRLGDAFAASDGAPLRIIAAPEAIFAAQLERGERNDLCVALAPVAASLVQAGIALPRPELPSWRARLAVARRAAGPAPVPIERLPELLAGGERLGIVDATTHALVDGTALLARLGLAAALAGRIDGEPDTGTIAWRLARGQIGLGTLFTTEIDADRFSVAATIPDGAYDPVRYAVLANRHVLSRNAAPFLAFLATKHAREILTDSGLEIDA